MTALNDCYNLASMEMEVSDELIKEAIKLNNFTSLGGIFLQSGRSISPLQLEKAGRLLIHFVKMFAAYYG